MFSANIKLHSVELIYTLKALNSHIVLMKSFLRIRSFSTDPHVNYIIANLIECI